MVHIVMIDCHDLGRHLGCYGQSTVNSENLDQLAEQGIRFSGSFCTAPQCSPSRASLYTGRYAHANGMFGLAHEPFGWTLHPDEVYLPGYLQEAGYETVLFGSQHVTSANVESVQRLGFDRVFLTDDAKRIAGEAAAFLGQPHERPFFLNLGFHETHRDKLGRFKSIPEDQSKGVAVPPYLPDTPEAQQEVGELQGSVRWLDAAISQVVRALRETDHLKDTWIIFTTDHGIAMPRAKCTMYDPGIETALIMYSEPLGLTGGRVIPELISHVDLVPTVLEALGIPLPARLQGRSYWALLQGQPYEPRTHLFAEKTFHTSYEPQRAVRTTRFKLIANLEVDITNVPGDIQQSPIYPQMIHQLTRERPPIELYDLQVDPQEQMNVADNPHFAEVKRDLIQVLFTWMEETGDSILDGPIPSPYFDRALRLLHGTKA